jgi:hypothetical protein
VLGVQRSKGSYLGVQAKQQGWQRQAHAARVAALKGAVTGILENEGCLAATRVKMTPVVGGSSEYDCSDSVDQFEHNSMQAQ